MVACQIGFRTLTRADFPVLGRWLASPHVARWWAHDTAPEAVEADFGEAVDGREPTELFVVTLDGVDVGLVQRYAIRSYPEYVDELRAAGVPVPDHAWSIDYFLGDPATLGRGIGAAMLRSATDQVWADTDADRIVVPVHEDNVASRGALRAAGYVLAMHCQLSPDNPCDDRRHVVMVADRWSAD